ncbi:MAG: hypothetical protein IPL88_03245 [Rhizobiales bacterium]|nr:hypothetical protein [Hyphomicrobiales bacterium]
MLHQYVRDCFREHVAEYTLALQAENPSMRKKASIAEAISWARERYPNFVMPESTLYAAIAKFRDAHGAPRPLEIVKAGGGKTDDQIEELMEDPDFDRNELLSEGEREDIDRENRRVQLENHYILIGQTLADQHLESIAAGLEGPLADASTLNDDDISGTAKLTSTLRDAAFDAFFSRIERSLEERFAASAKNPDGSSS